MDQVSFHFCVLRAPAARAKKTWWCRKMRAAHFSTPPCHVFRRGPVARGVTPPCHVFRRGPVARRHARRAHTMSCFPARLSRAPSRQESTHHVMLSGAAQSRAVTPGEHTTMSFWRGPVARGVTPPCHVFRRGPVARGANQRR